MLIYWRPLGLGSLGDEICYFFEVKVKYFVKIPQLSSPQGFVAQDRQLYEWRRVLSAFRQNNAYIINLSLMESRTAPRA